MADGLESGPHGRVVAAGEPTRRGGSSAGVVEPFFGSDRWHYVYELLGLPHTATGLLRPGEEAMKIAKL